MSRAGEQRLWTVTTVARRLAVVHIGRAWRVEPSAVDAFVAAHRTDVVEDTPPAVDDRQLAFWPPDGDGDAAAEAAAQEAALFADSEATPTSAKDWPADRLTLAADTHPDRFDSRGFHTDAEAARGEVDRDGPDIELDDSQTPAEQQAAIDAALAIEERRTP